MQDPRSRKDWMLDILDQVMPAETAAQVLFWSKYPQCIEHILFELGNRLPAFLSEFNFDLGGKNETKYLFDSFSRGLSLLLGSEDEEGGPESAPKENLRWVQKDFLDQATHRTLTSSEDEELPEVWDPHNISRAAFFLKLLLTDYEDGEVKKLNSRWTG
jgi:hypothetical protein